MRDSGLGADVVRSAAVRIAIELGADADRETLQWVRVLESALGKVRSATRLNPRGIPNLATAIALVAADRKVEEELVAEAGARRTTAHRNPHVLTTVEWIRELEAELAAPEHRVKSPEKAAPKTRTRK